ncbi:thioesterase-like superfamily-domain-containing protein [Aspergillus floccosus]
MDSAPSQISLCQALDVQFPKDNECLVQLPEDICYGNATVGGLIACIMSKYALSYASEHPKTKSQTTVHSANVHFLRPVFPEHGRVALNLHELSICRARSTLSVELFQDGPKMCASAIVAVSDFSLPGITVSTGWQLTPPPRPVNLDGLSSHSDPDWICYHPAFHTDGFLRAGSYAQIYVPTDGTHSSHYAEQWIAPGWDCSPAGSSSNEARWTTDMLQFVVDIGLGIPQNLYPTSPNGPLPVGSSAATLEFAAAQKKARDAGETSWRLLATDGSTVLHPQLIHFTLSMSTEVKKELPPDGVRWLYLRSEVKSIRNGRMDLEVLLCDQGMELVALSRQVAVLIPSMNKKRKNRL